MENTRSLASEKKTHFRWAVMAVIFIGYVVCMADRSNIGTVLPFLKKEFSISNFELGAISSFFFLGYAISQIPAGLIISKKGTRTIVSVAILGFSIVTFLMGHVVSAIMLLVLRLLLGLAEGPAPVGMTTTINSWFPRREKATATGLYIASTQFAPIIAPIAAAVLATNFGWRSVFLWFALPGILMAGVWFLVVRGTPEESSHVSKAELEEIRNDESGSEQSAGQKSLGLLDKIIRYQPVATLDTNAKVLRSWGIWGDMLAYFFMNNVLYGMLTWIPSYLTVARHYSIIKMGFVAAAPSVGGLIGAVIGGWVSDKIFLGRRKPTMLLTALATAIMMVVLIRAPQNTAAVTASLMLAGFFLNIGWPCFTAYPMGITSRDTYSFAISLVNSGGNLGGFFAPIIIGALLDAFHNNYNIAFLYFVAVLILGFVLILSLKEPRQSAEG